MLDEALCDVISTPVVDLSLGGVLRVWWFVDLCLTNYPALPFVTQDNTLEIENFKIMQQDDLKIIFTWPWRS